MTNRPVFFLAEKISRFLMLHRLGWCAQWCGH